MQAFNVRSFFMLTTTIDQGPQISPFVNGCPVSRLVRSKCRLVDGTCYYTGTGIPFGSIRTFTAALVERRIFFLSQLFFVLLWLVNLIFSNFCLNHVLTLLHNFLCTS